ncbi:hypothetical protein [Mycolicibacterium peregrinum]|uniref:hypothetical protein n=1 Tax=Mycolicibacterium peregrinum TaxID=43304 RepID=UPI003AAE7DB7
MSNNAIALDWDADVVAGVQLAETETHSFMVTPSKKFDGGLWMLSTVLRPGANTAVVTYHGDEADAKDAAQQLISV